MSQIVRRADDTRFAAALAPRSSSSIIPRVQINIRPATLADVPFIDQLQKAQSREVGFLPTKAIEGKIKLEQVLVAEVANTSVGYLIAADRYFKRDEIGY